MKKWNLENTYAKLPNELYNFQGLNIVKDPKLIILNEALALELELDVEELKSEEGIAILAGNSVLDGTTPLSQAYAGHQFGHFTMLGDGRALLLGEQVTSKGERFDIQLKGSGRTLYSRGGDGRAGIGPMLREYIISEALYALKVPTTRSLAVVGTGESVVRESLLSGAILTRVASSHIRVGTFQYLATWGNVMELKELSDYTISRHYPEVLGTEELYLNFLKAVIKKQASLIAKWQLIGFIHGVMNTDNMTISGETIDYGPCAFMDVYDPATVFSSIDTGGRYAYGNQPNISVWNLTRFAETLLPLLDENREQAIKLAEKALSEFSKIYETHWNKGMASKLGLFDLEKGDEELFSILLKLMQEHKADYTNTFRLLTMDQLEDNSLFIDEEFRKWKVLWEARRNRQEQSQNEAIHLMQESNPVVIPRNHLVEGALQASVVNEDYEVLYRLLQALANPFDYTSDFSGFIETPELSGKQYRTYCGT